ncbi:MAG: hypothetical protein H2049_11300 [Porphyrobacter sp.]|nr:hypothetical protein [Porphyrobacter sp.]
MVAGTSSTTFINEFHYDNVGTDVGEFVEITAIAGTSLAGWSLLLYNGNGGIIYSTTDLGSITPTTADGRDFYTVLTPGLQNGAPDGFALVDNNGNVVQFLSYEGTFTASTGPAAGLLSTDVGVVQNGTEAVGTSLQLTGTGTTAGDFTWSATSIASTAGAANTGQSFGAPAQPGSLSIGDAAIAEGDSGTTNLVFTVTRTGGSDGAVTADYALTFGSADAADVTGATSGTVSFAAGATSATITIAINGDTLVEPDETFTVTLANPTGGVTIGTATATGTITNDDVAAPPPAPVVFINEIHYDNTGTDVGEFIEVAGTAGTNLNGWTLVLYNGNGGAPYATINLTGTIDDEGNGFGALSFAGPSGGIQNGPPDGVALVDASGNVVEFLSYEGTFVAVGGPASGLTSTDIGVSEAGTEAVGLSLQRTGTGTEAADFTFTGPAAQSVGSINAGQTFNGGVVLQPGTLSIANTSVIEGDSGTTALLFTVTRANGDDGAVTADYTIDLGTASAADIAAPLSGTVSFADGATTATITVNVIGDTEIERDETLSVTLSNPTGGATITAATATGTILNDDLPPPGPAEVFINEIHYDTAGADVGEFIEVAGAAGTDLTGWSLVLYNGNGGVVYGTIALNGVIPNQDDGFGTLAFLAPGLQNGSPDGVALVNAAGQVVQFLSYEGPLTATNGPAAGLTSIDIGVSENSAPLGTSLQAGGTGFTANDFVFQTSQNATFGQVNTGQNFVAANPAGTLFIADARVVEGNSGTTAITFNLFRVGGSTGAVTVDFAAEFGSAFSDANADDFVGALSGTVTFADGETFRPITLQVAADTVGEPIEFFRVALSNVAGGATIGDGTATGTIANDDPLILRIGQIQGAGHTSPFVGNEVTTSGIVTAVATNGFYLQDPTGDGNRATSDALFVFTGTAPTVVAGDGVTVLGTVGEFRGGGDPANLTITQLTSPTITVESTGNALPTAVLIGPDGITPPTETIDDDGFAVFDPENDGIDFFESLEGMLVTVQNPVAVDATSGFGELYTVASDGAGNLAASNVAASGLVTVRGGPDALGGFNAGAGSDFNPERIQIDEAGALNGEIFAIPDVAPGTVLDNVTGVVDYAFGNFQIRPTAAVTVAQASTNVAETTTLATGAVNQLAIATYNVLNLDIRADDGDDDIGSGQLAGIAFDIGFSLSAPDIVVLQEIQDDSGAINDGTTSALLTLQALADSIFDQTGVRYSVFDNPFVENGETGGQPGGNIRVAFLYRGDRVDLDEASAFTITNPDDGELVAAFQGSRAPLGANFTFNGQTVTVIGNHFTSKIGSNTSFSAVQPPLNAAELVRAAQAAAINGFVDGLLASNPNALIAVAGDFNEFQFEEPLRVLSGELEFDGARVSEGGEAVLENLTFLLSEAERYTAVFEGNAQAIDHIFASRTLAENAQVDVVHTNTILGNLNADHDPVLALFNVGSRTLDGGSGNDVINGNDGNDTISGGNGNDTIAGAGGNDTISGGNGNDVIDGGDGNDTISGGNGNDTIAGAGGNDTISSGNGNDVIDGGDGNDTITSGNGNDTLRGGAGDDSLAGGTGNDRLEGGLGSDSLSGGTGSDTFVLRADLTSADADLVTDFNARTDVLQIDGAAGKIITFTQSGANTLIEANGVLVATVTNAAASQVRASTQIVDQTPAAIGRAALVGPTHSVGNNNIDMFALLEDRPFTFAPQAPVLPVASFASTATTPALTFNALFGSDNGAAEGLSPAPLATDPVTGSPTNPWLAHGQFGLEATL